jgi:hypothetical protein
MGRTAYSVFKNCDCRRYEIEREPAINKPPRRMFG